MTAIERWGEALPANAEEILDSAKIETGRPQILKILKTEKRISIN